MMLAIIKASVLPCYLIHLRPKYLPQHPILKHSQPLLLPQTKFDNKLSAAGPNGTRLHSLRAVLCYLLHGCSFDLLRLLAYNWALPSLLEGVFHTFMLWFCPAFRSQDMLSFYGKQFLVPHPNPNLVDHTLSAVRDCLFKVFAATLHTGDRSSIRNLRTHNAVRQVVFWFALHKYIYYFHFLHVTFRCVSVDSDLCVYCNL